MKSKVSEIPLEHNELGSIFVGVSITDKYKAFDKCEFLLDTGATSTVISKSTFVKMQLDESILNKNRGIVTLADGSGVNTSSIILSTLKIGIFHFSKFPVRILLTENTENFNILGTDVLKYFNYSINMSNSSLKLELRKDYKNLLHYDKTKRKNKELYKDMVLRTLSEIYFVL